MFGIDLNGIAFFSFLAKGSELVAGTNLNGVVFNEILADPNSNSCNFDTDGDGSAEATDEFLELFNTSGVPVDVSGWVLTDAAGNTFTIPAGTIIQPGGFLKIVTNYSPGIPPPGCISMGSGSAFFNNGAEAISLSDGMGNEIGLTYNGGTSLVPAGCNTDFGSDKDGKSIQASPDGSLSGFANCDTPTPLAPNTCFTKGTEIMTSKGLVKVEELSIGDRVLTKEKNYASIKWLGRKTIQIESCQDSIMDYPVRIMANAFGENLPSRDLTLSPDHALFIDETLINVGVLADLSPAIVRVKPEETFQYYHIELDSHQVIVAEGLEVESLCHVYKDRSNYDNGTEYIALYPEEERFYKLPMSYPRVSSYYRLSTELISKFSNLLPDFILEAQVA